MVTTKTLLLKHFCRRQGSVNGGFQTVVRVFWGNEFPLLPFYLNLTSFLPQSYLFLTSFLPFLNLNLTSASSRISNHGLETTVYRLLENFRGKRVYTTTVAPLLSRSVARPRGHRTKKAMVYTIFLREQGKRAHTTGPERRVYTIEAPDPE